MRQVLKKLVENIQIMLFHRFLRFIQCHPLVIAIADREIVISLAAILHFF